MKTYQWITAALLAAALLSCEREMESGEGKRVRFSVNAPTALITKTNYSGQTDGTGVERIDWVDGDLIRIASAEVSAPAAHRADYTLALKENSGRYSYATAAPADASGHGLIWGEGTHTFHALYPAPSATGTQTGLSLTVDGSGGGTATLVLPEDQNPVSRTTGYTNENYYGDMLLGYMTAMATAAEGTDVTLSFTPAVTTYYVTVTNDTGAQMNLLSVALSSAQDALTGTYRAAVSASGIRTYTYSEGGSWVGTPTRTDANSRVRASFGTGRTLADGESLTVALFTLPRTQTQMTLTVTSAAGEVRLPLKYEGGWLNFTGEHKHNLNNFGVPTVEYNLTVSPTTLTYDYTGTAGAAQEFTVTATKTVAGSVVSPSPWKTMIKSGNTWVDLDGNCPAWLSNYPLNSTGVTTASRAYREAVGAQPVVSHEARLASNKVYDASGAVYDNSQKANAVDLSKYNFINRRQETLRTTANTYIVAAPGWYKIPMVYGNLIENGSTVANACKGRLWALGHLDYFKKATDANIYLGVNYPWLQAAYLDHCGIHWEKYTHWNGSAAETTYRQWSSGSDIGVVTDLELNTSEEYMYFRVDGNLIRPGNVLLATYGDNGDCCWSWQIWITDQKMDLITVGDNQVLPVNLGWIDDSEGQHYPEQTAVLKFVSTEKAGVESAELTVAQPEFDRVSTSGWQTYYQWGRKDPMSTGVINVANDDGLLYKSILHPTNIMYDESTWTSDEYYDWTSANYNNLWDSQNNDWTSPTNQLPDHKTVYDPSPRGYSVPPDEAWDSFTTNGYERFENGLFFYTSSSRNATIFFPASGFIHCSTASIQNAGSEGYYWSIRPGESAQRRASYSLRFQKDGLDNIAVVPKAYGANAPFTTMSHRAFAYSVRPVLYNVSAAASEDIEGSLMQEVIFARHENPAPDWGWTTDIDLSGGVTVTEGDVSITVERTTNLINNDPTYVEAEDAITLYRDNRLTVSIPSGRQIIQVNLFFAQGDGRVSITAASSPNNGGGYTDGNATKDGIWRIDSYTNGVFTPTASSVSFTTGWPGSARKVYGLSVIYR